MNLNSQFAVKTCLQTLYDELDRVTKEKIDKLKIQCIDEIGRQKKMKKFILNLEPIHKEFDIEKEKLVLKYNDIYRNANDELKIKHPEYFKSRIKLDILKARFEKLKPIGDKKAQEWIMNAVYGDGIMWADDTEKEIILKKINQYTTDITLSFLIVELEHLNSIDHIVNKINEIRHKVTPYIMKMFLKQAKQKYKEDPDWNGQIQLEQDNDELISTLSSNNLWKFYCLLWNIECEYSTQRKLHQDLYLSIATDESKIKDAIDEQYKLETTACSIKYNKLLNDERQSYEQNVKNELAIFNKSKRKIVNKYNELIKEVEEQSKKEKQKMWKLNN